MAVVPWVPMNISLREDLGYHVFSVLEAPTGWEQATFPPAERSRSDGASQEASPESVWEKLSGVSVADSKFTVIVPIHNEESSLEGFFGSLMYQKVPPSAPVQIVFVANACSDKSYRMVLDTLTRIGQFSTNSQSIFADATASPMVAFARNGNISFALVSTPTAGKWNALNIGNEFALRAGHRVALCVDSDSWLEPGALALVAGEALRNLTGLPGAPTIVSGDPKSEIQGAAGPFMQRIIANRMNHAHEAAGWRVAGPLMAWDTKWLDDIGGVPQTKLEDYMLGVISRREGRSIVQSKGTVWQFAPATALDDAKQTRRFVHGAWQILKYFDGDAQVEGMVRRELHFMQTTVDHMIMRFKRMWDNPLGAPGQVAKFFFLEGVKFLGRMDFERAPEAGTWEKIKTTKIRLGGAADASAREGSLIPG